MRLKDRRILITGAASGIGFATAGLFLKEGARLALLDLRSEALAEAVRSLAGGEACASLAADVSDPASVAQAVDGLAENIGGLDGVVNSAGIDLLCDFAAMSPAQWSKVIAVNLTGPVNVCQAALPWLKRAGGGSIVNIASGAALLPLRERTAYCASKAGLVMFGKALAMDLADDNIRVNSICPGAIDTPMLELSYADAQDADAALADIAQRYVLKRIGKPIEIARAALYLMEADSGFVTGTAMAVDGGRAFH